MLKGQSEDSNAQHKGETISRLTHDRKVRRLSAAKQEAERLLEDKSTELYEIQRGMEATIEARTKALNEKVVELEALKQQIETERDKAIAESANKTTLFAKLSHEIRTPLNGIVGTLNLLTEEIKGEHPKALLGHANRACDHLKAILNDAIDLAKLENGMVTLEKAPMNLSSFLEDVLYFWHLNSERDAASLSMELSTAGISSVSMDSGRLRQVLDNFLSNAIKYGGNGPISLSAKVLGSGEDARLVFSVSDSGKPLTPKEQRTIFEPYFQAASRSSLETIGTGAGLGLAICRELTQVMGADIGVTRAETHSGNCFSVTFNLADLSPRFGRPSDDARPPQRPAIQCLPAPQDGGQTVKWRVNGRAPRALIVEDVPTNQMILESYLRRWGVLSETVENGKEALNRVQANTNHPFDIILMDIAMPVMDGYEATRRIRALEGPIADIPIIGVSAHTGPEDMKTMLECGMVTCVAKPIDRALLRRRLENIFQLLETENGPPPVIEPVNQASPASDLTSDFADDFPKALKDQLFKDISDAKSQIETALTCKDVTELLGGLHKLKSLTGTFEHPAFPDIRALYDSLSQRKTPPDETDMNKITTALQLL